MLFPSVRLKLCTLFIIIITTGLASSIQFTCSVMSDSLRPHGLQHARPPCPVLCIYQIVKKCFFNLMCFIHFNKNISCFLSNLPICSLFLCLKITKYFVNLISRIISITFKILSQFKTYLLDVLSL